MKKLSLVIAAAAALTVAGPASATPSTVVWTPATTAQERLQVLAALARAGRWVHVYYGWRPNLRDEGDNHLIELAVAGNAQAVVTHNVRDLARGELAWPHLRILTPAQFLQEQP